MWLPVARLHLFYGWVVVHCKILSTSSLSIQPSTGVYLSPYLGYCKRCRTVNIGVYVGVYMGVCVGVCVGVYVGVYVSFWTSVVIAKAILKDLWCLCPCRCFVRIYEETRQQNCSLAPVTDIVYTHTHTHTHTQHSHKRGSMLRTPEFSCSWVCTHTYKEARNEMQSAVNRHLPGMASWSLLFSLQKCSPSQPLYFLYLS